MNPTEEKGITLIALIITVIILLILAGTAISISINGGNIFGKTAEAGEKWNAAVKEEEKSLQNTLSVLDAAASQDIAKHKLTVTVNEDQTVESPYYVYYPSKKYIEDSGDENCKGIKCRVLYNDSTYGLQIISADSVTRVKLGKNDPNENVTGEMGSIERAISSYNRMVMTLNEKAEEYIETANRGVLAIDARCVGSLPLDKNYPDRLTGEERQAEMFFANAEDEYMNEYNGKFFKADDNRTTDSRRLYKIGCRNIANDYFTASRGYFYYEDNGHYFCPTVQSSYGISRYGFLQVHTDGTITEIEDTSGFRPVIILQPNVKIIGGEGTEENPFEIGL